MFWWYEREGQHLGVEVLEVDKHKFELRLTDPDGTERFETFVNADDLATRQTQLQDALLGEGWTGPHGWVI
jgi:hypothetical protein